MVRSSGKIEWKTGAGGEFKRCSKFTRGTGEKQWNLTFQWRMPLQISHTPRDNYYRQQFKEDWVEKVKESVLKLYRRTDRKNYLWGPQIFFRKMHNTVHLPESLPYWMTDKGVWSICGCRSVGVGCSWRSDGSIQPLWWCCCYFYFY